MTFLLVGWFLRGGCASIALRKICLSFFFLILIFFLYIILVCG